MVLIAQEIYVQLISIGKKKSNCIQEWGGKLIVITLIIERMWEENTWRMEGKGHK